MTPSVNWFLFHSVVWVKQMSRMKQFAILQNDVMYQPKQFRKLNCWLEILTTAKTNSSKRTGSHPRILKKIHKNQLQRPTAVVCNFQSYIKTEIKLYQNWNLKILKPIKFPRKHYYFSSRMLKKISSCTGPSLSSSISVSTLKLQLNCIKTKIFKISLR